MTTAGDSESHAATHAATHAALWTLVDSTCTQDEFAGSGLALAVFGVKTAPAVLFISLFFDGLLISVTRLK